jgi:hypothetical protein
VTGTSLRSARRPPRRALAAALVGLVGLVGCSRFHAVPAPRQPVLRALARDLERQVTIAAAAGWGVDRLEVEELLEPALDSTCRVARVDRRALLGWLDGRIADGGGPVAAAWRERGRDLDAVADLLVLTRMRMLLARADELADQDCPFWLEPEAGFAGRQTSHGRWQLTTGGGGKGIVVRRGGDSELLFGGAGRLLIGRVADSGRALYLGVELGANASFPRDAQGERSKLVLASDLVVPVVLRLTGVNSYLELEAGWLGRATEEDLSSERPLRYFSALDHGVHLGVSVGGRALRTRFFFPGAALGFSVERAFTDGADPMMFKLGVRFALDVDLN